MLLVVMMGKRDEDDGSGDDNHNHDINKDNIKNKYNKQYKNIYL